VDELFELGKEVLASQPFSKVFGAELRTFSPGHVELAIPITSQLKQQHGFVHGGVISYAADNALTFVGGSVLGPTVVTSEYKINYLRPAIGEELVAKATVVYSGQTQAVCRCDLFVVSDGKENLCAVSQGTVVKFSQTSEEHA
jgi:uncharacterized protein (TIGR00369 family)